MEKLNNIETQNKNETENKGIDETPEEYGEKLHYTLSKIKEQEKNEEELDEKIEEFKNTFYDLYLTDVEGAIKMLNTPDFSRLKLLGREQLGADGMYYTIGLHYYKKRSWDKAIPFIKKGISESGKDMRELANGYNVLGLSYLGKGELANALKYSKNALETREKAGVDSLILSASYNNVSRILIAMGRFEEALYYNEKGIEMDKQYNIIPSHSNLIQSYYNISETLANLDRGEEALQYLEKLLEEDKKSSNKFEHAYNLKGEILRSQGDLKGAIEWFEKAQEISPNYFDAYVNEAEALLEIIKKGNVSESKEERIKKIIKKKLDTIFGLETNIEKHEDVVETGLVSDLDSMLTSQQKSPKTQESLRRKFGIEGLIFSKLADISYIKDKNEAQKELERYFGDYFRVQDYYSEGIWEEFGNTFTENFEKLHMLISILPPVLAVNFIDSISDAVLASGFAGYCIKAKNGKKYFIFRGTEFKSWKELYKPNKLDIADLVADIQIAINKIPSRQVEDMIDFVKKNIATGEKISFVGHSLGGNLSQIASAIFGENLEKTYSFNSPGAEDLDFSESFFEGDYKNEIINFQKNRKNSKIRNKVINYEADDIIAQYGEDIGMLFQINQNGHGIGILNDDLVKKNISEMRGGSGKEVYNYKQALKFLKVLVYMEEE